MMRYTVPLNVIDVVCDATAPRSGQTVSGYGAKIPTPWRVRYVGPNGRDYWHRVYVMQYGNAGTPYIVVRGESLVLDTMTDKYWGD